MAINDVEERISQITSIKGKYSPDVFHKRLGKIVWDYCGMSRTKEGLEKALKLIPELRKEFYEEVLVLGEKEEFNQCLEKALRVADFLEFSELLCLDALMRNESCGGHFREEYQTKDGEALRNDEEYCHVSAWQFSGENKKPNLFKEQLDFSTVKLETRSYK